MKLLELIHPYFGAISICDSFLGDSLKENVLDKYDRDGKTRGDAITYLLADLDLEDPGFNKGWVHFKYNNDGILTQIVLYVEFDDSTFIMWSNRILYDYLDQSEYFDDYSNDERKWTYRNGINEVSTEVLEQELTMTVNLPLVSRIEPDDSIDTGVLRTVSNLIRRERDEWDHYVLVSTMKKKMLAYSRESEDYPLLWLLIPEEEYENAPFSYMPHLTTKILRMIMTQSGMEFEAEAWSEKSLERIVFDPISCEPMNCVEIEDGTREKPMTREELEEALDGIEYWDNVRTAPPGGGWDETPIG